MFQAIETEYRGCRFRSRLESRWAVYFDTLGIKWEYEREGFILDDDGTRYLPDFWLPQVRMWAEVKGEAFKFGEIYKCCQLARHSGFPCLLLEGMPEPKPYRYFQWVGADNGGWVEDLYCALSMHKKYPEREGRFFVNFGSEWDVTDFTERGQFSDTIPAAMAARRARFEFGEQGAR